MEPRPSPATNNEEFIPLTPNVLQAHATPDDMSGAVKRAVTPQQTNNVVIWLSPSIANVTEVTNKDTLQLDNMRGGLTHLATGMEINRPIMHAIQNVKGIIAAFCMVQDWYFVAYPGPKPIQMTSIAPLDIPAQKNNTDSTTCGTLLINDFSELSAIWVGLICCDKICFLSGRNKDNRRKAKTISGKLTITQGNMVRLKGSWNLVSLVASNASNIAAVELRFSSTESCDNVSLMFLDGSPRKGRTASGANIANPERTKLFVWIMGSLFFSHNSILSVLMTVNRG